MGGKGKVIPVL